MSFIYFDFSHVTFRRATRNHGPRILLGWLPCHATLLYEMTLTILSAYWICSLVWINSRHSRRWK